MRRFPVIFGIVVAFLAGLLVSNFFTKIEVEGYSSANHHVQDADRTPVAAPPSVITESEGGSRKNNSLEQKLNSAATESDDTSVKNYSMESQAVSFSAINSDFVMGSDDVEESFSRLAEEFRNGSDVSASEKREQFRQFFYSQSQLLGGEISLDVLECGAQLCVAELRSADSAALRAFMDARKDWQGFESKAIIEAPTQQPNITRLIFSHDPEINGITLPSFGG